MYNVYFLSGGTSKVKNSIWKHFYSSIPDDDITFIKSQDGGEEGDDADADNNY